MREREDALQWLVAKAGQSVKFCHGLTLRAAARVGV
jgi:hypothetical protein